MKSFAGIKKSGIIFVCLVILLLAACGRKSDVVAPKTTIPAAPKGLIAVSHDQVAVLRWIRPAQNTDKSKLTDLAGFVILRREESEALAASIDERKRQLMKIAEVKADHPDNAEVTPEQVYIFLDRGEDLPAKTLTKGAKYAYQVRSQNRAGELSPPSPEVVTFIVASPLAPPKLKATAGESSVYLEWAKVDKRTDGNPAYATIYYNLYRSPKGREFPLRPVNPRPLPQLSYTDTTVKNNQTYYYTVRAADAPEFPWHESDNSPVAEATPRDLTPPVPPRNFTAIPGEGLVGLVWEANTEPDLLGYYVYRRPAGAPSYQRLNDKPLTLSNFQDKTVQSRQTYSYYVTAVDQATPPNESAPSKEMTVSVP